MNPKSWHRKWFLATRPSRTPLAFSDIISLALDRGASTSRTMRRIASTAAWPGFLLSTGFVPVKSSYRSTPSEWTSLRASMCRIHAHAEL